MSYPMAEICPRCGQPGYGSSAHICMTAGSVQHPAPPRDYGVGDWTWKDGYQAGWVAALKWRREQEEAGA
jgi:hypothetical protein